MGKDDWSDWKPEIRVHVCGREWILERAADMECLWNAMTELTEDERLPYWTELWPSSLALAEWLYAQRERVHEQPCMDLGCGLGLTALVGQWLGARVIGADYEPEAVAHAQRNAARNQISQPGWLVMDWRHPAVQPHSLQFVWGGDIMYEKRFAAPVLDFFEYALTEDGIAWIAEPSRTVYDSFRSLLQGRKWSSRCVFEKVTAPLNPQPCPVPVRIWELCKERKGIGDGRNRSFRRFS